MNILAKPFKQLCTMLFCCVLFSISTEAASVEIDGLYYILKETSKNAELTYQSTASSNYLGKVNIVIPETISYDGKEYTVTTISNRAFAMCTSLESISIPGTVTTLGTTTTLSSDLPFYGCTSLKSVRFEDGTDKLTLGNYHYVSSGGGLFSGCSLEEIYLGRNIGYVDLSDHGYSAFYNQANLKKVTIGEKVTSLPRYIFRSCTALTYVDFGSSLTSIPSYAFYQCRSLTSVILPETAIEIGDYAFYNCNNLKIVSIPGVKSIGSYAFYNNTSLSALELSNSLNKIDSYTFYNTIALKSISLPNSLNSIGASAFEESGILFLTIPLSVTKIGKSGFSGSKVVSVSFGEKNISLESSVFASCTSLTDVTIAAGQQTISESCFANCTALKNVSLSDGLTTISDSAFSNCPLESISIPGTVINLGLPFFGCTSLKSVRFEDGTDALTVACRYNGTSSGSSIFKSCPLEEIYLGRSIKYTGFTDYVYAPFYNQTNLKKITFGENVATLPEYIFYACSKIASIICLSENPASFKVYDGFSNYNATLYYPSGSSSYTTTSPWSKFTKNYALESEGNLIFIPTSDTQVMVAKYPGTSPEFINIPSTISSNGNTLSVTKVMEGAFASCENLTNVIFPSSITEIGEGAFAKNDKLASITFNGQKIIGKNAFRDCKSITTLTLPSTLETIGERAFYNIPSLTQVSFGSSLKTIGKEAFASCGSLTAARMPNTLETIETSAFENCVKLTYVTVGNSLQRLGNRAFFNCNVLTEIEIPGSTLSIGDQSFENCSNLTLAILNSGTKTIGSNCFKNCVNLTTMSIPGTVTLIDEGAFDDCTLISTLSFLAGEEDLWIPYFLDCPIRTLRIGRNLKYTYGETGSPFRNKTTINRVSFTGNYVTNIYNNLFDGCSGITSVIFPENLESINDYAFHNCSGINAISFPASLRSISDYAFHKCAGINEIEFSTGLKVIKSHVFDECSSLSLIEIPEGVTTIGNSAFENCSSLIKASLPSTLETINNDLYKNCVSLAQLELKEGLKFIKAGAFDYCITLNNLSLPGSVLNIEENVFRACSSLSNLRFEDSNTTLTLDVTRSMFGDSPLKKLYVGRNISYTYTIPSNVPFYQKEQLEEVTFSSGAYLNTILPYFLYGASSLPTLVVPDNITSAGKYAFANCSSMESIQLSNSLPSIEEGLLQNCSALKSLVIPSSVLTVNNYALGGCSALTDLRISDSDETMTANISATAKGMCSETTLESLYVGRNINYSSTSEDGYSPFYNITTLKNVTFNMNGNISNLGDYYLYKCSAVKSLDLPESLTIIGTYSLADMSSLEFCRMRNNVAEVGSYGFAYDVALTDLTFSNKVKTLTSNLFYGCIMLPNFTVYPAVTSIQNNVFTNCRSLSNITFENGTDNLQIARKYADSVYSSLFKDCPIETLHLGRWLIYDIGDESCSPFYSQTNLVNLTLGETVGDIGKFLFEKCSSLQIVEIPGVESIGEKSFYECSKLSDVIFNNGTRSLGEYAFSECVALDNVKLPSTVVSISEGCFMNCTSLNSVDMGTSLEIIGPNSFAGCSNLKNADIPETVYGLGVESFKGCTALPYVNIPKGISSVGARAFQGCNGAEWLTLSERCTSLGANSFDGCTSIRYIKSYNPNPPVGLPNFANNVLDNGTLFVPGNALEDYMDADIWLEFFTIKPLTNATFVSYVNLDTKEATLKAAQTVQLNAEAGPNEATDTSVGFVSDNNNIAIVDATGLVTAVSVGEANIKAYAKDGSGFYQICKITVEPTLAERIDLSNQEMSLRVNRMGVITAEVYPVTTTNKNITWTSSNNDVATIDEDGNITAIYDGVTTITAEANDGSGTVATCQLTVLAPITGDSNDNDAVTITDAVNTANYAVGNDVENFNFRAADVNGDNRITLADASGTVTIILEQPTETSIALMKAKAIMAENDNDLLVMEDFSVKAGQSISVPVRLDNTVEYVALQADVTVPEGMKIESVTIGNRAEVNHSLLTKRIDDNTVRIVLFDLNNSEFADNNEPLFNINVISDKVRQGEILIGNILASDAQAHEYSLYSTGGNFSDMTGIDNAYISDIYVETAENAINIFNAENREVAVFATDGTTITRFVAKANIETINVVPGIYMVSVGENTAKVIVK